MTIDNPGAKTINSSVAWSQVQVTESYVVSEFVRDDVPGSGADRPVTGALWMPPGDKPVQACVLLGHGASGDRYQAPIPHLAQRFCSEKSWAALSIDGPVHGLRQVGAGGREAFWPEMQRPGCVDDMVADWHAALHAARSHEAFGPRLETAELAYFGLSMGSMFGIPLLASDIDVKVAVLGLLGTTGAGEGWADRLLSDASKITVPLLFLMQLEDELFPRDGYLRLFDAFASEDKRLHANPGLHPEVTAEEIAASFSIIEQYVSGTAKPRVVNPLAE